MKNKFLCQKIGKQFRKIFSSTLLAPMFFLSACGEKGSGGSSLWPVVARLQSSDLAAEKLLRSFSKYTLKLETLHRPLTNYTLTNIDGMADSMIVYTAEDGCAFNLWRAGNVGGAVGVFGRVPEYFDLTDPESWDPTDGGIREGCEGAAAGDAGMLFQYMDFHINAGAAGEKVIRLVMSNTKSDFTGTETVSEYYFHRGDLLIKNKDALDSTFVWASTDGTSYPVSSARPTEGAGLTIVQDNEVANDPIPTGNDEPFWYEWAVDMYQADGSTEYVGTMNREITKGVLDFDTSRIIITASPDESSNAEILAGMSINALQDRHGGYLRAKPTFLKEAQIGTSEDPDLSAATPE